MKGAVLYGPGDIRFEDRETPKIIEPTDAVLRLAATCVCGSDLWHFLRFYLREALGEEGWPWDRDKVLADDPALADYTKVPRPWELD